MKRILISGCAGFIGFHLSKDLSKEFEVIGIDSFENKKFSNIAYDRIRELKKKILRLKK